MIAEPTPASSNVVPLRPHVNAAENSHAASLSSDLAVETAPPPDLLLALDRAAKVAAELAARRLSVRFETGPSDTRGECHLAGAHAAVRAHVIDADGNVVRQLPVAEALELLSGLDPADARTPGAEPPQ
jgi:hypothetical protein